MTAYNQEELQQIVSDLWGSVKGMSYGEVMYIYTKIMACTIKANFKDKNVAMTRADLSADILQTELEKLFQR